MHQFIFSDLVHRNRVSLDSPSTGKGEVESDGVGGHMEHSIMWIPGN